MEKRSIINPAARASSPPYSPCLVAGTMVFVSGQVGVDPTTGQLTGDDMKSQTHQALENMRVLLKEAGLRMEDVVKTTVFLTRMEDFQAMNVVYLEYFSRPLPARSTVQVSGLAKPGFLVEIEAMALRS